MELHVFFDRGNYEVAIDTINTGLIVWVVDGEIQEWFDGDRHTGLLPVAYRFVMC